MRRKQLIKTTEPKQNPSETKAVDTGKDKRTKISSNDGANAVDQQAKESCTHIPLSIFITKTRMDGLRRQWMKNVAIVFLLLEKEFTGIALSASTFFVSHVIARIFSAIKPSEHEQLTDRRFA